jgi:hypothetical protein
MRKNHNCDAPCRKPLSLQAAKGERTIGQDVRFVNIAYFAEKFKRKSYARPNFPCPFRLNCYFVDNRVPGGRCPQSAASGMALMRR